MSDDRQRAVVCVPEIDADGMVRLDGYLLGRYLGGFMLEVKDRARRRSRQRGTSFLVVDVMELVREMATQLQLPATDGGRQRSGTSKCQKSIDPLAGM